MRKGLVLAYHITGALIATLREMWSDRHKPRSVSLYEPSEDLVPYDWRAELPSEVEWREFQKEVNGAF